LLLHHDTALENAPDTLTDSMGTGGEVGHV
jgi:hypothetical protein